MRVPQPRSWALQPQTPPSMDTAEDTASAKLPPALPEAPIEKVCEFPDKLSPMLVKELRQGLRTFTFASVFLTLQGILTVVLLVTGLVTLSSDSTGGGAAVSMTIFCFYALVLLVVQPLRGISALSSEIKGNTIDLMVLTRLSAWRIVWGKWTSIVSQSGLILLAVLPYLIFRYFFGGMQLFSELFLLGYLFVVSATLTALSIGISGLGSGLIRGIAVVGGGGFLAGFVLFEFTGNLETYISALSLASTDVFLFALGLLVLCLYLGYFALELATSFIAPAAENRATHKRLIGLAVALSSFLAVQAYDLTSAVIAAGVVGMMISFDAYSESATFPRAVTRPFLRRGALGRLCGRFLYPGWASGNLFVLLFAGLMALLTLVFTKLRGSDSTPWLALGISLGVMLFPAAMMQLFAKKSGNRHSRYLALAAIGWSLTCLLTILYSAASSDLLWWIFCPVPMVQAPMSAVFRDGPNAGYLPFIAWLTTALYWAIVMISALPEFRRIRAVSYTHLTLPTKIV